MEGGIFRLQDHASGGFVESLDRRFVPDKGNDDLAVFRRGLRLNENVIAVEDVRSDHAVSLDPQQKRSGCRPSFGEVQDVLDILLGEKRYAGCYASDDRHSAAAGHRGYRKGARPESLFLQKSFPLDCGNVVLHRRGVDPEMPCNFSYGRGVLMRVQKLRDEVQNGLLFCGEHAGSYTEHAFGSQEADVFRDGRPRDPEHGAALILALVVLAFLSLAGGALLTAVTFDLQLGRNALEDVQAHYLAESAIEEARERLRARHRSMSELLRELAGPDGVLSRGDGPEALEDSDDIPFVQGTGGERGALDAAANRARRSFTAYIRNDSVDGAWSPVDTNDRVTVLGFGTVGTLRKTVKVTLARAGFPLPAPDGFPAGSPASDPDALGLGSFAGLDRLLRGIQRNATDVYKPADGERIVLENVGSSSDYRVVVIDGDGRFGPGQGFGVLLVRGSLEFAGRFRWNGVVLVAGDGGLVWTEPGGTIFGALHVVRPRSRIGSAPDVFFETGSGTPPRLDLAIAGRVFSDPAEVERANRRFPYLPVSYREP